MNTKLIAFQWEEHDDILQRKDIIGNIISWIEYLPLVGYKWKCESPNFPMYGGFPKNDLFFYKEGVENNLVESKASADLQLKK